MAVATWDCAQFDNNAVTVSLDYDTTSLVVQDIRFQNLTSQNGAVVISIPARSFNKTYPLAANTSLTTRNVASDNIVLTSTTSIDSKTGTSVTVIGWPTGVTVSFQWPA